MTTSAADGHSITDVLSIDAPVDPTARSRRFSIAGSKWRVLGIGLIIGIGAFLRIWSIGRSQVDADSAVVGLMAREILHGHFFAFYWGQKYGGLEPYVVALLFAVFGQSAFTLALAPVLLDAVAVVLVWRVGRRVFSNAVAAGAALLFWVWPEVYVHESTIEYGFRFAALVCGLALLLVALQLSDGTTHLERKRLLQWTIFGLFAGLGFWASPEIAYYLIPALALLIWRGLHRRLQVSAVDLIAAVVAAILGALPWLYNNVTKSFPSFRHSVQPNPPGPAFINHLKVLFAHVLPTVLGLRLRQSTHWLFGAKLGVTVYVIVLIALAWWIVRLIQHRRAIVVVVFIVLFPIIYAYSPFTWFWSDSRYALYLAPMLALFVLSGVEALFGWAHLKSSATARLGWSGIGATIVIGLGLTLGAATCLGPYTTASFRPLGRFTVTTWQRNASGMQSRLANELLADGIHDLIAGYWLAYPLAFASRGQLTATDVAYSRYQPYVITVEASPHPAWFFVNPANVRAARTLFDASELDPGCAVLTDTCLTASDLESWLKTHHDGYKTYRDLYFVAIVPEHKVPVNQVFIHFGVKTRAGS